ncbi:hypothetical protein BO70DRAFT_427783 [Aspergillus heteromorphus CBS 117.55]|uniref:Glycoside hydrolase subgroup catalytic core n=1 Tax=Aspergillus heteromorphus CBS 117.55 TaxID=1448321 RepID=A0A317WM56_9EURO|nr:uncharacterized protein BO70DRAFT_427783 [Aspergillus heteromorphus CBS 117.55]PWY86781.1 hypothetical protein BO70DRAFT_427783 [Aspergillus heteromorphus CBS 117.55]
MWTIALTIAASLASLPVGLAFNNPPGVDICNASFNPGGWFEEPSWSSTPLLNLKVRPRMSIYLESDATGSLLIDTTVSHLTGDPLPSLPSSAAYSKQTLHLNIHILTPEGSPIASITNHTLTLDSTNNDIALPFSSLNLSPRRTPYIVTTIASLPNTTFTTSTELYYLPQRTDGGSATRIDHLHGGLSYIRGENTTWTSIFPFTYYVQWSLYWDTTPTTLETFSTMGYNVIHIVPTGTLSTTPFPWTSFSPYLSLADRLDLHFQYDVLWDATNLTRMIDQVNHIHTHPSLLLYYTGDEPDGKSDALNATQIAYAKLKELDPYHPVSLALNCKNFYYTDYAAGADIILSDVYPVATNTSWSTVYETPCNATYGCCGCDDCTGRFEDVSERIDGFRAFDELVGWEKTHWGAPQAFGNETFWTRYPTPEEEVVMVMLSVNHGAMGIVMWDFPTSEGIKEVTGELSRVVAGDGEVVGLLLDGERDGWTLGRG